MSHKGGPFKSRPGKAATTATSASGHVSLTASTGASGGSKVSDNSSGDATLSRDALPCIRAILGSNFSGNCRLAVVQRLLKSVVSTAGAVVRGTDAQRKFTSLYTEFCTSALRSLGDLEDAVYELFHPGSRAADADDNEIEGIPDVDFIKQVAAYVATHTSVFSVAYLEHVGQSALEKLQKQRRKRERTSTTNGLSAVNSNGRVLKVSRPVASRDMNLSAADGGGAGVDIPGGSLFDSISLVDAHGTVRNAMHLIEGGKQDSASSTMGAEPLSRRGIHASGTTPLTLSNPVARPPGVFLSKAPGSLTTATATSDMTLLGNGTVAYELCNPHLKLSNIPELCPRLQPWKVPLPSSGVYLDRVTMDRDRRGGNAGGNSSGEPAKAVLEVCLAPTLAEFLREWENRETALTAVQQQSLSGSAPVAGSHSVPPAGSSNRSGALPNGGSPRSTTHLSTPPLAASPSGSSPGCHPPLQLESESCTSSLNFESASVFTTAFFPAERDKWTMTCMPTYVMVNLSHYGLSKMDFVYPTGPAGKYQA